MNQYGNPNGAPPPYGYGPPPYGGPDPAAGPVNPYPPQYGMQPYAPPQAAYGFAPQPVAPAPAVTSGAPSLRWYIVGSLAGAVVFYLLGIGLAAAGAASDTEELSVAAGLVIIPAYLLGLAMAVLMVVWEYQSWAMLPPEGRFTAAGKPISPGQAIGFLFIPFFNLYWMFVARLGLCEALDRQLTAYGSQVRAPRGLALTICILTLIPFVALVNLILLPIYIFGVDKAKADYLRLSAGAQPGMQPGNPMMQPGVQPPAAPYYGGYGQS